jgi:uncharacterized membrane protein HdeD (DUF308 family)
MEAMVQYPRAGGRGGMLLILSRSWSLFAIRGCAAVCFGLGVVLWPAWTAEYLVFLFGAFAVVDGLAHGWFGMRLRHLTGYWWLAAVRSVLGIVPGMILLSRPAPFQSEMLGWIAAWALFTGVLEMMEGVGLGGPDSPERLLILLGVQAVAVGAAILVRPSNAEVIVPLAGYSVITGLLLLGVAARLRTLTRRMEQSHPEFWACGPDPFGR